MTFIFSIWHVFPLCTYVSMDLQIVHVIILNLGLLLHFTLFVEFKYMVHIFQQSQTPDAKVLQHVQEKEGKSQRVFSFSLEIISNMI